MFRRRAKSIDDLENALESHAFWDEQRTAIMGAVLPVWLESFVAGAELAFEDVGLPVDVDAVNRAADDYIERYSNDWWERLETGQRERLRSAILQARQNGLSAKDVARLIEDDFGAERAMRIAITEVTTLLGAGAQEQYRASGFRFWQWRTAKDERVCPICGPREDQVFPMSTRFEAAHPRCRCWAAPFGDAEAANIIAFPESFAAAGGA